MPQVRLDIVPPETSDYATLEVYEAATQVGAPGALVSTIPISSEAYPTYVVVNAASAINWFTIRYLNSEGAPGPYSDPFQGGTFTLLAQVVVRVMQRDATVNENVVVQEAEAVIEEILAVPDAMTVGPEDVTSRQLRGIVYLTLARTKLSDMIQSGEVEKFSAGLITVQSGDSKKMIDAVKWLIDEANRALGINTSFVAQLEKYELPGIGAAVAYDHTRLLVEIE